MIMENVGKYNYESAGDAIRLINDETEKVVIDLFKTAQQDDYKGVAVRGILSSATPEKAV